MKLDGEAQAADHRGDLGDKGDAQEMRRKICSTAFTAAPRHAARFNIKTGEALTAPVYEAIPTFPVREEDGVVQVRDDRWD